MNKKDREYYRNLAFENREISIGKAILETIGIAFIVAAVIAPLFV